MQNIASLSMAGDLVANSRFDRLVDMDASMHSTQSFEARFALVLALALAAQSGCARTSLLCESGELVDSESGPVCVFHRDSPLVIEGGFECPVSFGYRFETANAITCSQRPLTALPYSVCREIEDCVPMTVLTPTRKRDGSATNQCLQTCTEPKDCTSGEIRDPDGWDMSTDNFACVEGVCEYLGCNDDLECMGWDADPARSHCRDVPGDGRRCVALCDEKADCNDSSLPPQYATGDCIDEVCVYTGCVSDESCAPSMVCVDTGTGRKACNYACEAAVDCEVKLAADGLALDDDRGLRDVSFACVDGWCETRVTGCRDDADCSSGAGSFDRRTWRCDVH